MLPSDMDKECIGLSEAMNLVPGIQTIESCCGHGETPYRIWFIADDLESLPSLLYWFAGCHSGYYEWNIQVKTDCAYSPAVFMVEGPVGAYDEADRIESLIRENNEQEHRQP